MVIGAFAALAQGAPIDATYDIDITPLRSDVNLRRLSLALEELEARVRVDDPVEGLPFAHDAQSLAGVDMLNLTCTAGDFDLVFVPAGSPSGYDDIAPRALTITVGDQQVQVADLADVVRSKEEAGRAKDITVLPALRRYLRERRESGNL